MVLVRVYGTACGDRTGTGKAVFDKPPPCGPKNNSLLIHCDFELLFDGSSLHVPNNTPNHVYYKPTGLCDLGGEPGRTDIACRIRIVPFCTTTCFSVGVQCRPFLFDCRGSIPLSRVHP